MATNDLRMRTLRLELPGNRALHLCLTLDDEGAPADLTIGAGFASDNVLRVLSGGVCLPAECLPALRDALSTLQPDAGAVHGSSSVTDGSEAV